MLPLQGTQVQPLVRELKSHKANFWASLVAQLVKNLPAMWETWIQSLGWEDPLEEGMTNHSSILVWRIPWTEEPGRPQFTGLQRVGHNKRLSKHARESIIALTTRPVGSPKIDPAIQWCPQRPDSFPHYTLALPACRWNLPFHVKVVATVLSSCPQARAFSVRCTGGEWGLGDEEAVQQRVFCSGLIRGEVLSEMCLYVSVARTGSLDPLLAKRNVCQGSVLHDWHPTK